MGYTKGLESSADCTSFNHQPLVSVIVPAYNAARFIERTLHSALNQTYRNLEVIVIDDGSTDNTRQIVQGLAAIDSRLTYYSQTNAGVAAARNHGIERAKGEFIAPLDADDLWDKTNLDKQIRLMLGADNGADNGAKNKVGMVYTWSADIDEHDCLTGDVRASPFYGNVYPPFFYANVVGNGSACLIRRSCLEHVGNYSLEFRAQRVEGCEDWDIYLRIAKHYSVLLVPELLVGYRQARGSMSTHAHVMDKSQALAFKDISRQYPKVYAKVKRWATSVNHMYALSQHLQAHQNAQAWECLRKGLQADALIVLTTYVNWLMIFLLIARTMSTRLQSILNRLLKRSLPATAEVTSDNQIEHKKSPLTAIASSVDTGLRIVLSPLFPAWIIRELRMRWLNAKVSPHQLGAQAIAPWTISQVKLTTRLRAKQKKSPIDFSQTATASPATTMPIATTTQIYGE